MKNKFSMQGDVPIYPYEGEITGELKKHNGSFILAYGEKTGHHHTISVAEPSTMEIRELPNGNFILDLKAKATIKHQEHLDIQVLPGIYRIGREREKDWFSLSVRKVID